jgi:hypothetical protein
MKMPLRLAAFFIAKAGALDSAWLRRKQGDKPGYGASIVASSTSMMGMLSFT